jgi:hypothetical protein
MGSGMRGREFWIEKKNRGRWRGRASSLPIHMDTWTLNSNPTQAHVWKSRLISKLKARSCVEIATSFSLRKVSRHPAAQSRSRRPGHHDKARQLIHKNEKLVEARWPVTAYGLRICVLRPRWRHESLLNQSPGAGTCLHACPAHLPHAP